MNAVIRKIIGKMNFGSDRSGFENYKYDIMSDSIVWGDEVREFSIDELNLMREVWSYRGGIFLGEERIRYKNTWMHFQENYPHWIGFETERINPGCEVVGFLRNARRREERRMERYEKLENGEWFPLLGKHR